ncbi:MAG: hypothetical protein LBC03_05905 [Nitrososphaerota archaeon]|nr:hypothetical protein [Nitrososphaerota archaeon]
MNVKPSSAFKNPKTKNMATADEKSETGYEHYFARHHHNTNGLLIELF